MRWDGGGFSVHGSPWELEAFAVGHLVAEGLVSSLRDILSVTIPKSRGDRIRVDVELARSPRVRGMRRDNVVWGPDDRARPRSATRGRGRVRAEDLVALARILHAKERTLRAEGPLHRGVLYDPASGRVLMASDLSRHSAIDKVLGMALLGREPIEGRILYSTGRVGEEMTAKALRMGAGALATRSVPFRAAVDLAVRGRLLLVGKLRPEGFWVFAGRHRLARISRT